MNISRNYLILSRQQSTISTSTDILKYLINQLDLEVYIVTKEKLNSTNFDPNCIIESKFEKLGLISAESADLLMRKLLVLHKVPADKIPQVIVLDSFHLWLDEYPEDYQKFYKVCGLIATFFDLVNVLRKITNKPCFGIILINQDKISQNLAESFFDNYITTSDKVNKIYIDIENILKKQHKNNLSS